MLKIVGLWISSGKPWAEFKWSRNQPITTYIVFFDYILSHPDITLEYYPDKYIQIQVVKIIIQTY